MAIIDTLGHFSSASFPLAQLFPIRKVSAPRKTFRYQTKRRPTKDRLNKRRKALIDYLPHTSTNMATPIALPTSRIPRATALHETVIAIIKLTPDRALELLELMREITARARYSSKAFKISSFEPNALYVPSYTLIKRPAPGDFLILENDFLVTSITPVKVIHADVMPFYVTWEAYDVNERFKLTTAELDCEVLKAIARGHSLPPDSNSHTIKNATRLSSGIFNMTKDWPTIH